MIDYSEVMFKRWIPGRMILIGQNFCNNISGECLMRRILLLSIICAAIFLNFEAACPQQNVAEKIQIVENSLLPPVVINGAPVLKWSVNERLDFHRVPGVSVTVINDNKYRMGTRLRF